MKSFVHMTVRFFVLFSLFVFLVRCTPPCEKSSDCANGLYCLRGECKFDCETDTDCQKGQLCSRIGKCIRDEASSFCVAGDTKECFTGAEKVLGVGPCKKGTQQCENGSWGSCVGEILPTTEVCDGKDNNCDGQIDEGILGCACSSDQDCIPSRPTCKANRCYKFCQKSEECEDNQHCNNNLCEPCAGNTKRSDKEECDGVDNNCDGKIDDVAPESCFDGKESEKNKGICKSGQKSCVDGKWSACVGQVLPTTETCNQVDDNCDGKVDEGCDCTDGKTQPCGSIVGECKQGSQTCNSGKWSVCAGAVEAKVEICNGKDDNCDGSIDESYPEKDKPCDNGWNTFVQECVQGKITCKTSSAPQSVSIASSSDHSKIRSFDIHAQQPHQVLVADDSGKAKIWDFQQKQLIKSLSYSSNLSNAFFSPDFKNILAGSFTERGIQIWELPSYTKLVLFFPSHSQFLSKVIMNPAGTFLATASYDNTVGIYNTKRNPLHTLKGHTSFVLDIAFSPDGSRLASASLDQTIKIWDGQTFKELRSTNLHSSDISQIQFTMDSKNLVSVSADKTVEIREVATGNKVAVWTAHTKEVTCLSLSPDGKYIATGSKDKTVKIWNLSNQKLLETLVLSDEVSAVRFNLQNNVLLVGQKNGVVTAWKKP